jgi:cell division protein FtsB
MTTSAEIHSLAARISGQEQTVAGIAATVKTIEANMNVLTSTVQALANEFAKNQKPNWSVFISAGSLAIVIGTLALAPLYKGVMDLSAYYERDKLRLERKLERMEDRTNELESHVARLGVVDGGGSDCLGDRQ